MELSRQSHDQGTASRSLMWLSHGSSSATFPDTLSGSWSRSRASETQMALQYGIQHHKPCLNQLCHNISLYFFFYFYRSSFLSFSLFYSLHSWFSNYLSGVIESLLITFDKSIIGFSFVVTIRFIKTFF